MSKIFLGVLIFILPNFAHAMKVIGNGGDTAEIEFIGVANEVGKILYKHRPNSFEVDKFLAAIPTTEVRSTTRRLYVNGEQRDAINYPELRLIQFNKVKWESNFSFQWRAALVLHEYLGIAGIDDSRYYLSRSLAKSIWFASGEDAKVFTRILDASNAAVEEVQCKRLRGTFGTNYKCRTILRRAKGGPAVVFSNDRDARDLFSAIAMGDVFLCQESDCQVTVRDLKCEKPMEWMRSESCHGHILEE